MSSTPSEVTQAPSCFNVFNQNCTEALTAVVAEAKRLNDEASKPIILAGVHFADPALSESALQTILHNIERAKEYSVGHNLKEEFVELHRLLTKFYDIACESEIHIFLGAYRTQFASAFLVNPCSPASGEPGDAFNSYFESIKNSTFLGCVLKSLYLSSVLGVSSANGHELSSLVFNDVKYPRLDWFTKFAKRIHFDPVSFIFISFC